MQPEIEQAVEDICNESIITGEQRFPVALNLDNVKISDDAKAKMNMEFNHILRLWISITKDMKFSEDGISMEKVIII